MDLSFTGIKVDSYLDKLKPKPIKPRDLQSIFDQVCRQMYAQKMPCVRYEYDPVTFEPEVWCTNFNSYGFVAPVLAVFSRDDLRLLRKIVGYDTLQTEDLQHPLEGYSRGTGSPYFQRLSLSDQDLIKPIAELLATRGVCEAGMTLLAQLDRAHDRWYDYIEAQTYVSSNKLLDDEYSDCLYWFRKCFWDPASDFGLKKDVLDQARP